MLRARQPPTHRPSHLCVCRCRSRLAQRSRTPPPWPSWWACPPPNTCSACGSLDHIRSSCTAPDDALMRWALAKRKMIIQKYGTHGGCASAHAALLSDVTADDSHSMSILEDCTDEYDNTEVSVPLSSVAFTSYLTPGRDLSQFRVVDSAGSINTTAFRGDFATFTPLPLPLAWVESASTLRAVALCVFLFGWHVARSSTARSMHCTHLTRPLALLSASSRLLSVSWMQSYSGCEFIFPSDFDTRHLAVPT
jgi:hypothetical protein